MAYLQLKNTVNQSIPNSTLTELLWPTTVTDDGGFMVGSDIVVPFEGEAQGGVTLQWEASTGGNYRRIVLRVIDPNADVSAQVRYECVAAIPKSAVAELNYVILSIPPWFLHEDYEVHVYAQQDSGGALNIINATTNSCLTITNVTR